MVSDLDGMATSGLILHSNMPKYNLGIDWPCQERVVWKGQ